MRAGDDAVGGDHLAGADHEHVPGDELVDGHLDDRVALPPVADARGPVDERAQLTAWPCPCA